MFARPPLYILIYFIGSTLILVAADSKIDQNRGGKCAPLMFDCGENQCIPRSWRCDGDTDCVNGNDEVNCPKPEEACSDKHYKCKEPTSKEAGTSLRWRSLSQIFPAACIPEAWKCDGEFDCPEKDDEENCKDINCSDDQFKCKGFHHNLASCIPKSWLCDGQADCLDHTDEKDCPSSSSVQTCKDDEFKCDDGQCIFKNWECDGEFDCKDNSDEAKCNATICDPTTHFKCASSHFCLPIKWTCDGQPDCPDHSDERNCTQFKPEHTIECSDDEYQCMNKAECIRKTWVCDSDFDCSDGSDEANCDPSKVMCGVDEELCDDGVCKAKCDVPLPDVCDTQKSYKCNNNTCIPYDQLCYNNTSQYDCLDSVCGKQIMQCDSDSTYCQCRDTFAKGKICYCPKGFELQGRSCVDINECKQDGICDQKCTNLVGTYMCDCYPGFKLTGGETVDGGIKKLTKCRAIGSDPLILLSNRAAIRQYDLVTNKYWPLVNKLESAVAMDYWHANKTLIWSDVFKEQIMMCTLNAKGGDNLHECPNSAVTLIDKNISTPDGLAVDWVHGLLFWTDTGLDTVNVYDLNSKKRKILFNTGLEEPRAIAVDPSAGLIFWTDWGSRGRIERAGMDGSNRVEILNGDAVRWPNGLALDIYDQRVYWADAKTKAISSCDYWGKGVKTILHSHKWLKHPFSLAVFEEKLYWTDWDNEGVLSINKFNGQDVKVVMNGVPGPMTVRVYHEMAQPNHTNKCEMHNCEHICLPRALIREATQEEEGMLQGLPFACACESGYRVGLQNAFTCITEGLLGGSVVKELNDAANNSDGAGFTLFVVALIVAAVLLLGYAYRQRNFNRFAVLNFDNPVYRRTVEDVDGELEMFGDNTVGAIPINPSASQEPRLVLSSDVAAQYSRDQTAYMDNDPINHRGLY